MKKLTDDSTEMCNAYPQGLGESFEVVVTIRQKTLQYLCKVVQRMKLNMLSYR